MENGKAYTVGIYYLTKNRSGNWCRTWYDEEAQQRRSSSLRTADFETAKRALDDWFILNSRPVLEDDLELSRCLIRYYEDHAKHLKRADSERRNLSYWLEFFGESLVRELRAPQQRKFLISLVEKDFAKSTIEGIFKTGAAAVRYAWTEDMLKEQISFIDIAKELRKHNTAVRPKSRDLKLHEVVRLFENAGTDRLVRYLMILIGCACRPAAALELEGSQIDRKAGTISLLKPGKAQSNKYRATVRLPSFIEAIYHRDNLCNQGLIKLNPNKPMDSIKSSWITMRKNAQLDTLVNPGSMRKTMAKWLRTTGVEAWHTSAQLGHRARGSEITEIYAPNDPAYLSEALESIEGYFAILVSKSPKLQNFEGLKDYEPRCDLVAKYADYV